MVLMASSSRPESPNGQDIGSTMHRLGHTNYIAPLITNVFAIALAFKTHCFGHDPLLSYGTRRKFQVTVRITPPLQEPTRTDKTLNVVTMRAVLGALHPPVTGQSKCESP
jgi:hypothetical protein